MGKRIPELDGLRALAILAVFVGHALKVRMMWMGVDLFFVLSGFLITGILLDMPKANFRSFIGQFYARRARRILPPYVLLLVVVTAIFGAEWMRHWYLYFGLMNYVDFFYMEKTFVPLASLWSLAVEEQFYLVWPVVVFCVGAKKLPRVLLALLILVPVLRGVTTLWVAHQAFDTFHWSIYKGTPFRIDCLAMGALLTFLWRSRNEAVRRYGCLGLVATALTPPVMFFLSRHYSGFSTVDGTVHGNVLTYEISLCCVTGLMLWALGGRYTAVLRLTPVRWLGRISYSFYLIHESALELAGRRFHSAGMIALVAGSGTLAYAALSWYLMERPILHGGSRRAARDEAAAASDVEVPRQVH
jgi:peptidoglycan/LPS O-acetylase OafA/YrhL